MTKRWYSSWLYMKVYARIVFWKHRTDPKKRDELAHWIGQALQGEPNDHFSYFFTTEFGLTNESFRGKRLLDIGCGPAGSLVWATGAAERVGIDPLAKEYLLLGAWRHKMKYISAGAESIPYPDGYFDFIFSFNSLDHVDDLGRATEEIKRVLRPGGSFLVITDCNHPPTITEPAFVPVDLDARYFPDLFVVEKKYFEHTELRIYDSLLKNRLELDQAPTDRTFIMKISFRSSC